MVSMGEIIRDFADKPFDLYSLKGKEFTIVENLPKNGSVRAWEVKGEQEWNKGKPELHFFIKIEQGLFTKDLSMRKTELEALALAVPAYVTNFAGVRMQVDKFEPKTLKFIGITSQDLNGNKIEGSQSTGALPNNGTSTSTPEPISQDRVFINNMITGMRSFAMADIPVDSGKLLKLAEKISPGNAMQMIAKAKELGLIIESNNVYKVID